MSISDSEWDDTQRGWILALEYWRAGLCANCHGELAQTADKDAGPGGAWMYKPLAPTRCHQCTALMASDAAYSGNKDVPQPAALIHRVERVPNPKWRARKRQQGGSR